MHEQTLQPMIDNGSIWGFEGSVGRATMDAINNGLVRLPLSHTRDYYGSRIPSHTEMWDGEIVTSRHFSTAQYREWWNRDGSRNNEPEV
jgi:hypothetical protein